ncbi:MAG: glycine dehydrogenase [Verrucomicrobiales bacterium]|jgi:glycine dehydrogenase
MSDFKTRHLGSDEATNVAMATEIGYDSVDALIDAVLPTSIRREAAFELPDALSEADALDSLRWIMGKNEVRRSLIGMGYYDCITPPVILRNILENPGWYTAYTPYQAEISQGRLEACLNFQTMVTDLTGLDIANASLLDEGTAAAEAMAMCLGTKPKASRFLVSEKVHPQTIAILETRAEPLNVEIVVGDHAEFEFGDDVFGALAQYPDTEGVIHDFAELTEKAHAGKSKLVVATDLLALTLLKPPGEFGADIAVGNSQRFGVPLGFGGPHAGFIACADAMKRKLPGRIVGISKDVHGKPAYRLSLQTREQHIRRDKATSNICTAQVLLAVVASMYAAYHGPEGLKAIARRVAGLTKKLADALGLEGDRFDTIRIEVSEEEREKILDQADGNRINLRLFKDGALGVSLDEKSTEREVEKLAEIFGGARSGGFQPPSTAKDDEWRLEATTTRRESAFLTHPVFSAYHTETEMMRYLHRLEAKDIALNTSMIPLGSCTMKLNAAAEMMPLSWPEVNAIHPFAPRDQWYGYEQLLSDLESWLAACTGFHAVSLQPNAGSQGEYAGLLAIREFHKSNNQSNRNICLIPTSAHGTNPASAVMAGMKVVGVGCDDQGNIDIPDLRAKAEQHAENLAALMVTYPSTHGVFEAGIKEICQAVHDHGGQVYMDGANLNAQLGICSPGELGADVCHLNLHKTFCIPHGGGGPGVGPIGVAKHLAPYLPGHPNFLSSNRLGPVSAAPFGSASILTISWMYVAMMGAPGLTEATKQAILNANYIAHRLQPFFPVLYRGQNDLVAHECIVDLRPFDESTGVKVEDVAKRLMDYGFHAPTMSWPVTGTLMIEPTESESRAELDRFCDAMIAIHGEIEAIRTGESDAVDNPLKNAPHTAEFLLADDWKHPYSRSAAAHPAPWLLEHKYWPPVGRIDNVYGDRNLVCNCQDVAAYAEVESSG